jgi:hypothetical protein
MSVSTVYKILQVVFYCFCINAIAVFWIRPIDSTPLKYIAVFACAYLIFRVDSLLGKPDSTYQIYIYYSLVFAYVWYKSFIDQHGYSFSFGFFIPLFSFGNSSANRTSSN